MATQSDNFVIMKFRIVVLFIIINILCSSCNKSVKPTENEQALIESIQEILSVKKQLAETYWPEFDKEGLSAPIVFFEDSVCYVVNPREKFLKEINCVKIQTQGIDFYRTTRLDESSFRMDTHVDLYSDTTYTGRDPYVMCSTLNESKKMFDDIEDETQWIPMVIHELVHGCQDSHPNHYTARKACDYPLFELDLAAYPSQNPWLSDMLSTENDCLLSAISCKDANATEAFIKNFLECRQSRKEKMRNIFGESIVKEEEAFEMAESMARFMEVKSALLLECPEEKYDNEDNPFFSKNVQQAYFFVTGYNLVRLFVKLGIDLDLPYQNKEHSALEDYLMANS